MPKKFQGQKMDLSEKPRGVKAMPEGFLNAPPPPPAATKNPMGKTDASPIVSPRSAPRWGQDLPPILDLNSGSEPAPADGEASEGAPPEAKAEEAPASAELVAMGPEERAAAVADALARLLAEGMGVEPGNKESAASDLAECVKAFGIASLWKLGIHAALKAGIEDSKSSDRAVGALLGVAALVRRVTCWFEPYVMGLFPSMLMAMGYKAAPVRDAAYGASAATLQSINPRAARLVLPVLFEAMEHPDWRVKQGACQLVGVLAKHASSQLNICMPLIVPRVTTCLRDTKKEVAKAAKSALSDACRVIGNPDIEPVIPSMIAAMRNPEDTPQALEDLMHTTFIHAVDAASLSVIVPVLQRSMTSRGAMHEKRKAATVIINMCKLVHNPQDVEPFVPKLLPELKKSAEDSAFEEIRGVCGQAEQVLLRAMGEAGIAVINQEKAKNAGK